MHKEVSPTQALVSVQLVKTTLILLLCIIYCINIPPDGFPRECFSLFFRAAPNHSQQQIMVFAVFFEDKKTKIVIQICVLPMRFAFFLCFHMVFIMFCVSWLQNGGSPRTSSF